MGTGCGAFCCCPRTRGYGSIKAGKDLFFCSCFLALKVAVRLDVFDR